MNIKNIITNYLYDKNYFISLYDEFIYIYNYEEIKLLTSKKINISIQDFFLLIEGDNFTISKLSKDELLIKGNIQIIRKTNE